MKKTLIERIEVPSGGQAAIEFTVIPQSYTDLLVLLSGRTDRASLTDDLLITINGSTSNFTYRELIGTGSNAASGSGSTGYEAIITATNATANTFGNLQIYIPNYAGSNAKSISTDYVHENNSSTAYQGIVASLWNQTAAITSIALDPLNADFVQYSSASLYGITAGNDGITTVS
jgi:hypothetical protein